MPRRRLYRLDAGDSSLLLLEDSGRLGIWYLGTLLEETPDVERAHSLCFPLVPHGELDTDCFEPLLRTQDGLPCKHAALSLRSADRELKPRLRLLRCEQSDAAIEACFRDQEERFELRVAIRGDSSGIFRWESRLENLGNAELEIGWLASASVALPDGITELQGNDGFWANELQRHRLPLGAQAIGYSSERGRSSHQSSPWLIAGEAGFDDEHGEVVQLALSWSGNHVLRVVREGSGRQVMQTGVPVAPGEIRLAAGAHYCAPEALLSWSAAGVNGLREKAHRFWSRRKNTARTRKVTFNSWEALYFEHSEERVKALIDRAAALGAERFVLDDGWMRGREGPGAGLGDWEACPERYPRGLAPIAAHARDAGMDFGLWIEPEMVTADSRVAAAQPDWIIDGAHPDRVSGRGQFMLDIAREDVRSYLLDIISRLIRDTGAVYLKWDMNRDYAARGESERSANALTRAWYALLAAVHAGHPELQIEACSSGGARADAGALEYCDRIWLSDTMDAVQRFGMLRHASPCLPPFFLGWHAGAAPSSTSGVSVPFSTRCALAILGHLGVELDPAKLSDEETAALQFWIEAFKRHRQWMAAATYTYLTNPCPGRETLLLRSADRRRALLVLLQRDYPQTAMTPLLRLPNLDAKRDYRVCLLNPGDCRFVQSPALWQEPGEFQARGVELATLGFRQPFLQNKHCAVFFLECTGYSTPPGS